ncbi:hypothetical protein PoB_001669500 [Plakobranchus ocellatus]|uniref:Integrase zinc-binding domain-containing protein n=1 Tax=Plakobranchus ocellatus TaxID=259542 RepID=A0AAV3Z6K6_9GAST|nr:hypothetical protein PoB_001669500 [Plakobranchus ocellatus]
MDDLGIWEATYKSSWIHHMVTVPKPNGDYRITTHLSPLSNYMVEYRQGKDNLVADALSRLSMQSLQSTLHDPTHDHVGDALRTDHLTLLDVKSTTKRDSTVSHFMSSRWPSK